MALSQNTYVYMEVMEKAEDEGAKSDKDGSAGGFGASGGEQPSWTLVHHTYIGSKYSHDKRKTDKQWLL